MPFTFGSIFGARQATPQQPHEEAFVELHESLQEIRAIQRETSYFPPDLSQALRDILERQTLLPQSLFQDIRDILDGIAVPLRQPVGPLQNHMTNKLQRHDIAHNVLQRIIASGPISTCPICYEDTSNPVINIQCGHMLCWECKWKLLDADSQCPECRGPMRHYTFWEAVCRLHCPEKLDGVELVGLPKALLEALEKEFGSVEEDEESDDKEGGSEVGEEESRCSCHYCRIRGDDEFSNGIHSFDGDEEDRMMIGNENGLVAFVAGIFESLDYMNG
jgi:hypothetical protein